MRLIKVESTSEHLKTLYRLLSERPPHANISHSSMPSYEEHVMFVNTDPYFKWYMISVDDELVGSVYLTWQNEIGISILKEYNGNGYATDALELFIATHEPLGGVPSNRAGSFIAHIAPENERSKALFERLGFVHVSDTYRLER